MEGSAQKGVVHLIEEEGEKATQDLHEGASGQLNKAGLPTRPKDLNPHDDSMLDQIKHGIHNFERLAKEAREELTTGTTRIGSMESNEYLATAAGREEKKQGGLAENPLKKAA